MITSRQNQRLKDIRRLRRSKGERAERALLEGPHLVAEALAAGLAGVIGLLTQYFINMEIERYTLATGETALTGFNRFWKHWGLVFAGLVYFANLWPGWATSAATLTPYRIGGSVAWIAAGMLLAIGAILTLSPVVYRALEHTQFLKVLLVGFLVIVAAAFAVPDGIWAETPRGLADVQLPVRLRVLIPAVENAISGSLQGIGVTVARLTLNQLV